MGGSVMAISESCEVWIQQRIDEEPPAKDETGVSLREIGWTLSAEPESGGFTVNRFTIKGFKLQPVALISLRQKLKEISLGKVTTMLLGKLMHQPLSLGQFHKIPECHEGIVFAHDNLLSLRFYESGKTTAGVQAPGVDPYINKIRLTG